MKQLLLLLISFCPRQPPALPSTYIAELALALGQAVSVSETKRGDNTAAETCLGLSGLQDFKGVFAALTVTGRQFSHTEPLENGVSVASPEPSNSFCCIKMKGREEASGGSKLKINAIMKESEKEKNSNPCRN